MEITNLMKICIKELKGQEWYKRQYGNELANSSEEFICKNLIQEALSEFVRIGEQRDNSMSLSLENFPEEDLGK